MEEIHWSWGDNNPLMNWTCKTSLVYPWRWKTLTLRCINHSYLTTTPHILLSGKGLRRQWWRKRQHTNQQMCFHSANTRGCLGYAMLVVLNTTFLNMSSFSNNVNKSRLPPLGFDLLFFLIYPPENYISTLN